MNASRRSPYVWGRFFLKFDDAEREERRVAFEAEEMARALGSRLRNQSSPSVRGIIDSSTEILSEDVREYVILSNPLFVRLWFDRHWGPIWLLSCALSLGDLGLTAKWVHSNVSNEWLFALWPLSLLFLCFYLVPAAIFRIACAVFNNRRRAAGRRVAILLRLVEIERVVGSLEPKAPAS